MGMYDELTCRYPLSVAGANDLHYQTKDLDCQLDQLEIREDGTIWREGYDIEDRSDPNAEGWMALRGALTRVNKRWEQLLLTGEVRFYEMLLDTGQDFNDRTREHGWLEWSAYFVRGNLSQLELIRHELPRAADAVDRQ
jgi:hypothetical protein